MADEPTNGSAVREDAVFAYHVLRYASDLVRDEWVNVGVLLFDGASGDVRIRMVEGEDEFARIRRLDPRADEEVIRRLRDHLEDRIATFRRNHRAEEAAPFAPGAAVQAVIEKWSATLSNGIQLSLQRGTHAQDLDAEMERLYAEHVAPPQRPLRVGAPGSRAALRSYCRQVWQQARLWEQVRRSVRVEEFTFAGDPMRIDYDYHRNGTRGFVQTLSVSRSPGDCRDYAYVAERIARLGTRKSEFVAVTDVALQEGNERHRFVQSTLRDAGIEAVPLEGFAVWVAKLKPLLM